jgi:hypothetical protein
MEKTNEIVEVMGQRVAVAIEKAQDALRENGSSREDFLKLAGTWFDVAEAAKERS